MFPNTKELKAKREFRLLTKGFKKPKECTNTSQTRKYIDTLLYMINEFEMKFNYVPEEAHLLFNSYIFAQDQLIHKNFRKEYQR